MINDLSNQLNNNRTNTNYSFGNSGYGINSGFGNNSDFGNTLPYNFSVNNASVNRNNSLGNSGILADSNGNCPNALHRLRQC